MAQYEELCQRVVDEGVWVENKRTNTKCLTVINADMAFDISDGTIPVVTTKKLYWRTAIAEMLGYWKGYDNAKQFRDIGCNTWNANANENKAWLNNPYRKGVDDMGRVYGVQGRRWLNPDGVEIDQLYNIYTDLKQGIDDRNETITFLNPGERNRGCLNSCMWAHTFSILNSTLYLTSYQRSNDLPLGGGFNLVQSAWFLSLMAQITNLTPGIMYHKTVNAHIYENQLDLMVNVQLKRKPYPFPKLKINPEINTLEDVDDWVTPDDFDVIGYKHHPAIKYPFSV